MKEGMEAIVETGVGLYRQGRTHHSRAAWRWLRLCLLETVESNRCNKMAALVWAVAAVLSLSCVSGQVTNSLAGQTPIVMNGAVLPDNTFVGSTWAQVAAGAGALQSYTDFDLYNFLVNTECLEAEFDSAATFGVPLDPLLQAGGSGAIGARRANISADILPFLQETARDEAGHVRLIREALGPLASPCPLVNISAFGTFFANAFNTTYPTAFDPFANSVNLVLAIWSLEEIGATGDKGVAVLLQNATLRDGAAGLAVSAGYQASSQRFYLWQNRDVIVQPFGVSVAEVVQAISNYRDSLDGPANVDQGLFFAGGINIVPTDGNGVTFSRTPQQVLNILTCGAPDGRGCFFPDGVNGRINLPTPLGPQYASTRPGTNFSAFSGTGFANPNTLEQPDNVSTMADPPPGSQAPATLPATAVAVGQPVPNSPTPVSAAAPSPATASAVTPAAAPAQSPSAASPSSSPSAAGPSSSPSAASPSSSPSAAGPGSGTTAPAPTSGVSTVVAPVATAAAGNGSASTDGANSTPAPSSTGRKMI
ncbi:hypothetical protein KFL_003580160 [Klebsormidium nitens]|uniref:Desiccation-related protein PCC13-62 n=1 Tax=Klebsormidium nitens TaxID=105231 RepID=A0A1Y1IAC7_KLENI|nr:hypothetical protein KFL_003580160 [Klebsormidium nitens]|eukprot:GAQ87523.1 hypothetical protein KFL_003580160 [Klebsormidium nitens]